jgi:hypothetical protein
MSKRIRSFGVLGVMAMVAVGVSIFFGTQRTRALNPQPLPAGEFGMIGLMPGQTARLSVVNIDSGGGCPTCGACNHCVNVTLTFFDANGNPLLHSDGQAVRSTATLNPGQSSFLDLNGDSLAPPITKPNPQPDPTCGGSGCTRPMIRALVIGDWSGPGDEASVGNRSTPIISTLELFDNSTGKTTVLMPQGPPSFPHNPGKDQD